MNYKQKLTYFSKVLCNIGDEWILPVSISLTLLTFFSNINISVVVNVVTIIVSFLYKGIKKEFVTNKRWFFVIALLLLTLLVFSYFTPIDMCLRQNANEIVLIRVVPLCAVNGAYAQPRAFEKQGLKENIDFVVYDRQIWQRSPKYVILISFPYFFEKN
jgi:hypothetical protein